MTKNVYCIIDNKASAVVGGLHLFAHPAAAVRFFSDIASAPDTMVNRHPGDHDLYVVAVLDEETGEVTAQAPEIVLTGAAWKAAKDSTEALS